jgi:hypothetical protein
MLREKKSPPTKTKYKDLFPSYVLFYKLNTYCVLHLTVTSDLTSVSSSLLWTHSSDGSVAHGHIYFAWLAILGKAPTTNNLMKKNCPCNPSCALCYCEPENIDHLVTECNFAETVWDKIAQELQVHNAVSPFQKGNVADWITAIARIPSKRDQRINAGIICFFCWFLWKERSRFFLSTRVIPFFNSDGAEN